MMDQQFHIARLPRIRFGPGSLSKLAAIAAGFGERALLVTGARSFLDSAHWKHLQADLSAQGMSWATCGVDGEPSPELIDKCVQRFAAERFEVVIGIGGGSALDAAKAIAGLLRVQRSVDGARTFPVESLVAADREVLHFEAAQSGNDIFVVLTVAHPADGVGLDFMRSDDLGVSWTEPSWTPWK